MEEVKAPLLVAIETTPPPPICVARDDKDDRSIIQLGGWKCSSCIIGACVLNIFAVFGIQSNLVVYLKQEWKEPNAAAATTVTTFAGTLFLSSFLGALISDVWLGRLWTTLIFKFLSVLCYASIASSVLAISRGSVSASTRSFFKVSLYLVAITAGSVYSSLASLGADQVSSLGKKELYFRLYAMAIPVGQLLALLVTYMDDKGMWIWGFFACFMGAAASLALVATAARWYYTAYRSPIANMVQVMIAAMTKTSTIPVNNNSNVLCESRDELSAVPECSKLQCSSIHGAEVPIIKEFKNESSGPQLVPRASRVEQLRSFLWVLPVGIAVTLISASHAQITTIFEEQALVMDRQVFSWLEIAPASLNLFSIAGALIGGTIISTPCGAALLGRCLGRGRRGKWRRVTCLQLVGMAVGCCIAAMVIAACLESYRLRVAREGASLTVLWLVPQTFLLGMGVGLKSAGGLHFFYSEVSDGIRTIGNSMFFLFQGVGNYVSSMLVALVTLFTTQGGQPGWIASDLNEGHVDYFYWCFASIMAINLFFHLVYTHRYTYREAILN